MKMIAGICLSLAAMTAVAQLLPSQQASAPGAGPSAADLGIPPVMPADKRPAPPVGIAPEVARTWGFWTAAEGFKSIALIQLDATVFALPSVTVNLGGKAHVLQGKVSRMEAREPVAMNPGFTSWFGDGMVVRQDDGEIHGELFIDGQRYVIRSANKNGLVFLIGLDEYPTLESKRMSAPPRTPSPVASAAQR